MTTKVDIGDQAAIIVCPSGYDASNITIVRPLQETLPEPVKPQIETVADMLDQADDLQVSARLQFIRKVYIIVTIMLGITIGFCCLSYFVKGFYNFQLNNLWALFVFLGIAIAMVIVIMCCGNERLSNMGRAAKGSMLVAFVICFSYVISFITSLYAQAYGGPLVLKAMVATALLVSALTLYAFVVKIDFSSCIAIIIVVVVALVLFGISFAFTGNKALHSMFALFGIILAGIILVLDTQWVCSGGRGCSLDDPLLGALIIYLDIIRVFLYVLQFMSSSK